MTSATFHVCYASVANALFEHIEQDLLLLTTAILDDDDGDDGDLPSPGGSAEAGLQVAPPLP